MATDEELEASLGTPRAPPSQHQVTDDEWRRLMHTLDRIDRRVGRQSHLSITVIAIAAAWAAGDAAISHIGKGWGALAVGFAVFIVVGTIGMRELENDDIPAWLRGRPKMGWWERWRRRRELKEARISALSKMLDRGG
jgi:hypothetical protein